MSYQEFCDLAQKINDLPYGSDEQIEAANLFHEKVEDLLPDMWNEYLEDYGLKATDIELASEALTLLRLFYHIKESQLQHLQSEHVGAESSHPPR